MAKSQRRSNREVKKSKKSAAEKSRGAVAVAISPSSQTPQTPRGANKDRARKGGNA